MRRAALVSALLAAFAWPSLATAAPPVVSVSASPAAGAAPLHVTLTATGDPATYAWDFGNGTAATGPTVHHTFGPGVHTATVTATSPAGEISQAHVKVTGYAVTLSAPHTKAFDKGALFRGTMTPAHKGTPVTITVGKRRVVTVHTGPHGGFKALVRVREPGPYTAHAHHAVSSALTIRVGAEIDAAITGAGFVGSSLHVQARVVPAAAGKLRIRVWRDGTRRLDDVFGNHAGLALGTSEAAGYVVRVSLVPKRGYSADDARLTASVYQPSLSIGSHGPSVLALERQLYDLHYALRGVNTYYSDDTRDAVYAFQKIYGLPRTGSVDAAFWRRLQTARTPTARYSGDHIEVDKGKQVLYVVRGGQVILITHVSTGATGNTPLGTWHVYAKTPGWLPDGMFDSSFFLRGFAVHGYPEVPPWPASHGCVRVPVWLAPRLYGYIPWGAEIDIYQ